MWLRSGARGEAVKALQQGLNKLGAMLLVDGAFGGETAAAVADARTTLGRAGPPEADDALQAALAALPEPSPELTGSGVTFIGREEVSSPAAYRRSFKRPTWPTPNSGITIGIGYDLAHVTVDTLGADWGGRLSAATLERLAGAVGVRGSAALLARLADVEVSFADASAVFLRRMLPEHLARTRGAYPSLDGLPPHRRTVLTSLVFNRGAALGGDRRREMKRIRELLAAGDPEPVADQLEAMVRLWDPRIERGVIERRRREARLWRSGFAALRLA